MLAKNFRKTIGTFFSVMALLLLNGYTTPKEQAKIDAAENTGKECGK